MDLETRFAVLSSQQTEVSESIESLKRELAERQLTIEQAREIAARAWCQPTTSGILMDVRLCEEFAKILVAQK